MVDWARMQSARPETSNSAASTSSSWRSSVLVPWKSISESKLNHSNSTLTTSKS
jgi:hypothetical protein